MHKGVVIHYHSRGSHIVSQPVEPCHCSVAIKTPPTCVSGVVGAVGHIYVLARVDIHVLAPHRVRLGPLSIEIELVLPILCALIEASYLGTGLVIDGIVCRDDSRSDRIFCRWLRHIQRRERARHLSMPPQGCGSSRCGLRGCRARPQRGCKKERRGQSGASLRMSTRGSAQRLKWPAPGVVAHGHRRGGVQVSPCFIPVRCAWQGGLAHHGPHIIVGKPLGIADPCGRPAHIFHASQPCTDFQRARTEATQPFSQNKSRVGAVYRKPAQSGTT